MIEWRVYFLSATKTKRYGAGPFSLDNVLAGAGLLPESLRRLAARA